MKRMQLCHGFSAPTCSKVPISLHEARVSVEDASDLVALRNFVLLFLSVIIGLTERVASRLRVS